MNCNRISSYIRQLLHLNIRDHCLLGRLVTLNVDIITSKISEDKDLTLLSNDNEIITHYIMKSMNIDLYNLFESMLSEIIYINRVHNGVEIISINNEVTGRHLLLTSRDDNWFSGSKSFYGGMIRYDIFKCDKTLIKITQMREDSVVIECRRDSIRHQLSDDRLTEGTYDLETERQIMSCIDIVRRDMKKQCN